jgi:photosystem II stability/assembly factor-like uncharacterized protein
MRKLLIVLTFLFTALPLYAQWRRANLYGADVRALIIDPSHPDTLYLGTSGGEVYVSNDGAKSWQNPRGGIPFPGYVVDNLVLDRKGRLWAACWGAWGGGVVAVSEDGGKTWARRDAGLEEFSVRAIAIDPHDADYVLIGGLTGVYRSTDGGGSWEQISDQINVESLALDPRTHDRIYVGTWRQGTRSDDGGKTWKLINNGMVLDTDMFSITIDRYNPDKVWVSTCGWVYATPNRGENWTRYRDGFNNRRIHDIELDPCDPDSIFAGSVAGLYRSHDGGKTWYTISDESLVVNTIALHPQRPGRVILGVEGDGVYISNDNAKTFTRTCDGLRNLTITSIAADAAQPKNVYAAVAFGGSSSGIYRSSDAGATWKKLSTNDLPQILSLVITEDAEAKFLAGTEKGFFWSTDGEQWTQAPPAGYPIRVDKVLRFNKFRYFAATAEGVFTSRDSGKSWYRLAGAENRAVDITVGNLGDKRALFALTNAGLRAFDGMQWMAVDGAPSKGRTLAVRGAGDDQLVFVAGSQGVKAGHVAADGKWTETEAPDAQFASVFGSSRSTDNFVFLTSRQQHQMLVAEPRNSDWRSVPLPSWNAEITSVALDPFDTARLYVGTLGEGIFIYEGKSAKYEAKKKVAEAAAVTGTN